ncbi:uncharacterized protein LOC111382775 [Olea europaea var. sylvestris]|uniref:uncharacterized protein LOC111382775 n=1 Tax=Olea europaea var. sylvestris TaxID=158386 RepID=UPI000C1D22CE|nr:uncharacterized protein LOC111382775 [Olea europaea var. sylvestris]
MSCSDSSLFIQTNSLRTTILAVYVDDIIITGSDTSYISTLITELSAQFAIKNLGNLNYFLGIEQKYALDLLQRAAMLNFSSTPFHNPSLYRSIVGALQYITITRPDLAFAVNSVCQHMQSPTNDHFTAVKRILPYLKRTVTLGIQFTRGPFTLTAYSDADWAGDTCDRRSVSGDPER